jgi:hypothetical protein
MFAKLAAALLVFGWLSLSAFDLLEDLKFGSGASAYTQSGKSHSRTWNRQLNLANNIVESAVSTHDDYPPLPQEDDSQEAIYLLWSTPRVVDLHVLHRVFLI